jgi:hypothetical protein
MTETITGWSQLGKAERAVLEAVRSRRHGAQLFLVDPASFLCEAGFAVGETFAGQLRALPGVAANPSEAYEQVLAGRHPLCRQSIAISSLGLPAHLADRS